MIESAATMHPCARCATMQRTCCQQAEVVVTLGDVARITKHTGRDDFHSRRPPEDPTYLEHDPDDPNWVRYTSFADGTRRMLKRTPQGCTFLGQQGCVLPEDVRPLICRLYPWEYTEEGLIGEDAGYCPVEALAGPGASMLKVLDMQRADAERWWRALYDELQAEAESR